MKNKMMDFIAEARVYLESLAVMGMVPVIYNDPKRNVFRDVTIEGMRFQAVVGSYGPYLQLVGFPTDSYLGISSINFCSDCEVDDGEKKWMVCKYSNQHHIDITPLSDAGRRTLACEFGIPFEDEGARGVDASLAFYASPAFDSLQDWAQAHPRKGLSKKANDYLGRWGYYAKNGLETSASN